MPDIDLGALSITDADPTDAVLVRRGDVPYEMALVAPAAGGGGVSQEDFDDLEAEVADARGDRSTLGLRISNISNFASPNAGGVISGQYYDNAFHGTVSAALAGIANRLDMAPFFTSQALTIDQIGVAVATAASGALGRCFIYEAGVDGWPDALVYEGADDLDFSTTGYKSHSFDFTFEAGRQYWLGCRFSATGTIRAVNVSSAVNLGVNGPTGAQYFTVLRRTLAFATPLPSAWSFVAGDRAANVAPPSIRMRAAV
jgi:hypothetical protein